MLPLPRPLGPSAFSASRLVLELDRLGRLGGEPALDRAAEVDPAAAAGAPRAARDPRVVRIVVLRVVRPLAHAVSDVV